MRTAITANTLAALLLLLTSNVVAQNQPLAFEVASVKPVNSPAPLGGQRGLNGVRSGVFDVQNHRFTAIRVNLYALIKWSYGITASKLHVFGM